MRHVFKNLFILSALGLFLSAAQAASAYKFTILACPGRVMKFCLPTSISKNGIVVGYLYHGSLTALMWEKGQAKVLQVPQGDSSLAYAVNDRGQAVGSWRERFDSSTAVTWSPEGVCESLDALGKHSLARDINNAGQVVGWSCGATDGACSALVWNGKVATRLPPVHPGQQTIAQLINDQGWIGGYEFGADPRRGHAVIWKNGVPEDLGTLVGDWSALRGLNSSGAAVGSGLTAGGKYPQPLLWKDGVMTALPTGSALYGEAKAINDAGLIVGTLGKPSNGIDGQTAVIWKDGVVIDLNRQIPAKARSRYRLVDAVGIDAQGQIVGTVYDRLIDRDRAFLLSPKSGAGQAD